ncbi:5-oxoprolinase/urea amidolyase family protein [Pontibacillus yanchengensis]|uniref:5-oxoprolinase/urea amidolyase family protein n=2 Tax=Pontibacillus yanchengensis TaxID=462910 RepID=A0ACC7VHL3_9BACI|nr:biotin-dependent carboxyltransferase family protein [Pontibacillus yanchengensis]MYL33554.1 5-oxoprolinase/urea amidolyase family protein [Pontibacillus yanchengensis]MYL53605.1 5-oxoprolinase/urea amidolyase family protein [Pontibacillus yanchengensis]
MIYVKKPGLLSTLQDQGRIGYQKHGVIMSGVMDPVSPRIANLLVGNSEHEVVLEITMLGPTLVFEQNTIIALCGGDLSPRIDDSPIKQWSPIFVKKGSTLTLGQAQQGCRVYLAVAGGFQVPEVMGSKSTYLRAGIGGFKGRALQAQDNLSIGTPSPIIETKIKELEEQTTNDERFLEMKWYVASEFAAPFQSNSLHPIRIIKGREYDLFTQESQQSLFSESFTISSQSDRMGYRLEGSTLTLNKEISLKSEAVAFGTIQVPSNGQPILLMADRQTTGGYPKIAQVATVDLPVLAQMKPGTTITFEEISLEKAQKLFLERESNLQQLAQGIHLKSIQEGFQ